MGIRLTTTSIIFSDSTSMSSRYSIIAKDSTSVFYQPTAPTGWQSVNTQNDKALRVVSGSTGGTASPGGSDFTTAFVPASASNFTFFGGTVGGTTLALSQIASHNHPLPTGTELVGGGSGVGGGFGWNVTISNPFTTGDGSSLGLNNSNSHTHPFGGAAAGWSTDFNFDVAYIDVILCKFV